MSTTTCAVIVLVVLIVLLAGAYEHIDRKQHESERERIVRESLLSPEAAAEVDALEIQFAQPAYDRAAAAVDEGLAQLFEQLGPPPHDPALDEGCERLWDAIRDTNTTEGDQK